MSDTTEKIKYLGLQSAKALVDKIKEEYSPLGHEHNDIYYTETETDALIAKIVDGSTTVSKAAEAIRASSADTATNAEHATSADTATTAETATKAEQDGNGNVITEIYETKENAAAKLTESKEYTDAAITGKVDILQGAENSNNIMTVDVSGNITSEPLGKIYLIDWALYEGDTKNIQLFNALEDLWINKLGNTSETSGYFSFMPISTSALRLRKDVTIQFDRNSVVQAYRIYTSEFELITYHLEGSSANYGLATMMISNTGELTTYTYKNAITQLASSIPTIDAEISLESENPVQNKIIKKYVDTTLASLTDGSTIVAEATHSSTSDEATHAASAESATQDGDGNVITNTYETKENATTKFNELETSINAATTGVVKYSEAQELTDEEKLQARNNIARMPLDWYTTTKYYRNPFRVADLYPFYDHAPTLDCVKADSIDSVLYPDTGSALNNLVYYVDLFSEYLAIKKYDAPTIFMPIIIQEFKALKDNGALTGSILYFCTGDKFDNVQTGWVISEESETLENITYTHQFQILFSNDKNISGHLYWNNETQEYRTSGFYRNFIDSTLTNPNYYADAKVVGERFATLEEAVTTLSNNKVDKAELVQPDWNQNDENTSGYIKNRTHYDYTETITETREFIADSADGGEIIDIEFAKLLLANYDTAIYVADDDVYEVTGEPVWTGNSYYRYALLNTVSGTNFSIIIVPETGKIVFGDGGRGQFSNGTITVNYTVDKTKQLDEKFIPDTIVRVNQGQTNADKVLITDENGNVTSGYRAWTETNVIDTLIATDMISVLGLDDSNILADENGDILIF